MSDRRRGIPDDSSARSQEQKKTSDVLSSKSGEHMVNREVNREKNSWEEQEEKNQGMPVFSFSSDDQEAPVVGAGENDKSLFIARSQQKKSFFYEDEIDIDAYDEDTITDVPLLGKKRPRSVRLLGPSSITGDLPVVPSNKEDSLEDSLKGNEIRDEVSDRGDFAGALDLQNRQGKNPTSFANQAKVNSAVEAMGRQDASFQKGEKEREGHFSQKSDAVGTGVIEESQSEGEEVRRDGGDAHGAKKETSPPPPPKGIVKTATGVAFALVALAIISLGSAAFASLVTVLLGLVSFEYHSALRSLRLERATGQEVAKKQEAGRVAAQAVMIFPVLIGVASTLAGAVLSYLYGVEALGAVLSVGVVWMGASFADKTFALGTPSLGLERLVDLAGNVAGVVHVGAGGACAMLILRLEHGFSLLVLTLASTIVLDVAAYAWGSSFGKHPLAPKVSPNKSLEGLFGAVGTLLLCSFVLSMIARSTIFPSLHSVEFFTSSVRVMVLATVVGFAGTVGDLAESLVKRSLGIKDMGNVLPGHGGFFDRFDAVLFVLPCAYAVFLLWGLQ